jgi:gas vesicle protein
MENNKKGGNVGAFLSGVVVATAIGGYLLFGSKKAKKNRRVVEDWMEDAKADVVAKLKKVKRLSRDKYEEIVDVISDKYSEMKEVGKIKADELRDDLKSRWEEIEEEVREDEDDE